MDQIFYVNSASFVDLNIESYLHTTTGSLIDFSQATQVSGSFVGNLQGTSSVAISASYASQAGSTVSSSYAATASYVPGQTIKSGIVSGSAFSVSNGSLAYNVAFSSSFLTPYSITVTGGDSRAWFIQSQTPSGFTINANSRYPLISMVYWQAITIGETN